MEGWKSDFTQKIAGINDNGNENCFDIKMITNKGDYINYIRDREKFTLRLFAD